MLLDSEIFSFDKAVEQLVKVRLLRFPSAVLIFKPISHIQSITSMYAKS